MSRLTIIETSDEGVDSAKARLFQAARDIDPLAPLRKHPYTTVGVAAMSGFLAGSKDHPALMKTIRLSMTAGNLLKPVLLAAGKFAATHFAKKSMQSVADSVEPEKTS